MVGWLLVRIVPHYGSLIHSQGLNSNFHQGPVFPISKDIILVTRGNCIYFNDDNCELHEAEFDGVSFDMGIYILDDGMIESLDVPGYEGRTKYPAPTCQAFTKATFKAKEANHHIDVLKSPVVGHHIASHGLKICSCLFCNVCCCCILLAAT
ncbi:hypothetical protein RHGRI_025665 [Rhododendron griersonianum]|uniref:Uncharacterized protein n=1 Tax=Rhododendron griersonianum TaxID=479676 RepID=A0AAV6IUQ3_9ERIC|nr:hypothetical protein RHGRI_025665 [Rhododendron griersonianum]